MRYMPCRDNCHWVPKGLWSNTATTTHIYIADGETEAEHIRAQGRVASGVPSGGLTEKTGLGTLLALPSLGEHSR